MDVISASNRQWFNAEHTAISCVVRVVAPGGHADLPYLATSADMDAEGRALFVRLAALEFGAIAAYVAPEQGETTPEDPFRQHYLRKATFWRRCTDDEADAIDDAINIQPTKWRRIFNDATILDLDDPMMTVMRETMVRVFGEDRTDVLLAPTE